MTTLDDLRATFGPDFSPASFAQFGAASFALVDPARGAARLVVAAPAGAALLERFSGERTDFPGDNTLLLAGLTHANARALRVALPGLQPRPLGLQTSAGCGDRPGTATPGHVRAVGQRPGAQPVAPIFAHQSIPEMARTGRTPDAACGAFAEGWGGPVGADADHLKTNDEIDICLAAG